MDTPKVLEAINEALQAGRGLRQLIEADHSFLAEIESQVRLDEVKNLMKILKAEKEDREERALHPQTGNGTSPHFEYE